MILFNWLIWVGIMGLKYKSWCNSFLDHSNMRHSIRVQLSLHFWYRQSWVLINDDIFETFFKWASIDCVDDQREARRIWLPFCLPFFVSCTFSFLETEVLCFVVDVGPEVKPWRSVDTAEFKHNLLCIMRRSNYCLQVFCVEVNEVEEYLVDCYSCSLRECVDVELRFYSFGTLCTIINNEILKASGRTVYEKVCKVFVCFWKVVNLNFFEVW